MKKVFAALLIVLVVIANAIPVSAAEKEFDLIEYVENHKIESYSEFVNAISENTSREAQSTYMYSLIAISDFDEEYFNVEIDYENDTVEVDVIYSSPTSTMGTTKSGGASHETYSSSGNLIYTVRINGTFSYTSTSCSTTSKSGSFERGFGSLWSSTPSVTSGTITSTKAYARISGTATLLWESSSYQLTLMCDTSGKLTSTFTRP